MTFDIAELQLSNLTSNNETSSLLADKGINASPQRRFVTTTSVADLVSIFKFCNANSLPIFVYSGGQSWLHKPLDNGVYINFIDTNIQFTDTGCSKVKVGNSVKLRDFEKFLNQAGVSFPVLTSYLSAAIGGTLSVGGYGQSSCMYGSIVDQVLEIEVVLNNGSHLTLTAKDALFQAVLGGKGQLGCILNATFNVIPLYKNQIINIFEIDSTQRIIQLTKELVKNGDFNKIRYYKGQHWNNKFLLSFGHDRQNDNNYDYYTEIQHTPCISKKTNIPTEMWHQQGFDRSVYPSAGRHFWQDYIIPYQHAAHFAEYIDNNIHGKKTYQACNGTMLVLAQKPNSFTRNSFYGPYSDESQIHFGFGIYLKVPENQDHLSEDCIKIHSQLVALCKQLNGKPYLAGNYQFTAEEKLSFFGDRHKKFLACLEHSKTLV